MKTGLSRIELMKARTITIKPLLFGLLTGVGLVGVSILGLVVAFIEFLHPILRPGINLIHALPWEIDPIIPGTLLNGIIFAALFFVISFAMGNITNKPLKVVAVTLIIISFLGLSGMITNFLDFLASPDKSWIFEIGA